MADRNVVIQGLIELHMAGKGGPEAVAAMKKIVGHTKEAEKSVTDLGGKGSAAVGKLESSFISLGKTVAGYFAAGVVANFLRDSYIGFARTERQLLATENQIKSLGQAAQGAGFRDFISDLSRSSGILDDDLVPAFQRAILAFKDYNAAQEIVSRAARFAAAGIGDVQSNAEAMARFFQTGGARSLVQFGVNVKGGETAVLSLTEGFRLLDEQLAKQPDAFSDAQSRVSALAVAYDTLKDSIGAALDEAIKSTFFLGRDPGGVPKPSTAPFGPANESAVERLAREEQARRESDEKQKSAAKSLEIEKDRLAKIKDLNEDTARDLIEEVAQIYEVGTTDRLNLEIELNNRIRAAAVENAKAIGADVAAVNALFDEKELARERDFINATGPLVGQGGEDPEVKARKERIAADLALEQQLSLDLYNIWAQRTQWAVDSAKTETDAIIEAGSRTGHALASIFDKHKGFAIGMAIMDTSSAIMQVWSDSTLGGYWVKLAATIALAATGAAQIQRIRSASRTGGGGGGSPSIASAPTQSAPNPNAVPNGGPSVAVAPVTQAQLDTIAGRAGAGGAAIVVNIGTALGDRQMMTKQAREFARMLRNDQGALR
jgi:hypothetical protein